jgi:hypothetical protein
MPAASRRLPVLMRVAPNERVHKVFVIRDRPAPGTSSSDGEFRVFTKEQPDGKLELLGYHYQFDGINEHQSNILRARSVPPDKLLTIIRSLVEQTHTDVKQMDVFDLTQFRTRLDQSDHLAHRELLDAFEFE